MFIKKRLCSGILLVFSFATSFQAFADESVKDQTNNLTNGLNNYINEEQSDLVDSGTELIKEHQDQTKEFINKYNTYTAKMAEKTSRSISLAGDNECLANLRLIDLDMIPIDPMDLLKPLKLKLKDYIDKSPCDMVTDELNGHLDEIDFSVDSPFGSITSDTTEKQRADNERKRQESQERQARIKSLVMDLGSDFNTKVEERRNVVFDDSGEVINVDGKKEIKTKTKFKTEDLMNGEELLNVWEVFSGIMSDDKVDAPEKSDNSNSQADRNAADARAREKAKKKASGGT